MSVTIDLTGDAEGGGGSMASNQFTCVKCSFISTSIFKKIRICKSCSATYEGVVLDLTIDSDSSISSSVSDETIPIKSAEFSDIEEETVVEFSSSDSTSANNETEFEIIISVFSPPTSPKIIQPEAIVEKASVSNPESTSRSNENLVENFNKSSTSALSAEQLLIINKIETLKRQYSKKIDSQENIGKDDKPIQTILLTKKENMFLKNILELAKNSDPGSGFVSGDQDGWGCQSSQSPSMSSQDSCASSYGGDCHVPQTHWLMRKASILFIESQLEYCEKEGKTLQFNEILKKRILPYLQTESIKYLKRF